ncbi:hypothetical protein [Myroides odoratimimus]|uniref:hypothetical protein n=1 Tax=Myroides odoratimimus TaxID=76832 RepID=UPI002578FB95|nr:hypothetical protein [Myroides odoratimimus]MDM1494676.1 hypothetical protein [Myroides odoratimimus]MDM1498043.1 hypothetical protein [Myroides odoratimimus]MDM1519740.1 hypothetical protein [Myroides odoratimimus]
MVIEVDQLIDYHLIKYKGFINKEKRFYAEQNADSDFVDINLFSTSSDIPVFNIKRGEGTGLFKPAKYILTDQHGNTARLEMLSYWKTHYQCHYNYKVYDIYAHRGLKCSIFENRKQIAWWDKERISISYADNYFMIANNDVNQELLIAFCLAYDDYHFEPAEYRRHFIRDKIKLSIGNIFFEKRKFDKNWKANKY